MSEKIRDYAASIHIGRSGNAGARLSDGKNTRTGCKLLKAEPGEIAFVGPTSLALSFVAAGLPLGKGDNILVYLDDYPSNVYPWMALAAKGVEVRFIQARELGRLEPELIESQIDKNTRLVSLASCHFLAGWRIDP